MDETDEIEDQKIKQLLYDHLDRMRGQPRSFDEVFSEIQERQANGERSAEFADDIVFAGAGGGAAAVKRRRPAPRKLWTSTVAIAMSLILMFTVIGGVFVYLNNRDSDIYIPTHVELVMVAIDRDTLYRQSSIFIPNLDSLDDVVIARGDHRDTGVTKLFWIDGHFRDSRVAVRIIVYDGFVPTDIADFEGGSPVIVDERTVIVNTEYNYGLYRYRLSFIIDDIRYFVVLTTYNSGEYIPLLEALLVRYIGANPNPQPEIDLDMTVIGQEELPNNIFIPNLSALDNIIVRRGTRKDTGVTVLYEMAGYFGGSRVRIRTITLMGFWPNDMDYFLGGALIDGFGEFWARLFSDDEDIYRIIFSTDEFFVRHFVELDRGISGGYVGFLNAIFE